MKNSPSVAIAGLLVALSLLASACGAGASPSSEPSGVASASQGADVSSGSSSAEPTAQSADAPSDSPLGDLLGIPVSDDEAMEEYFGALEQQAEVKIAECMVAQGFQYKPVDYSNIDGLSDQVDFDSREFAEQYGFGIASNPFEESFEAFNSFEDPNQTYLQTLSEGEQEAYQTALSGQLPDFDSSSSATFESFEPSGCQGEAYDEVYSFGKIFDQFGAEFDEIEEAYNSDPRVIEATKGWSSCMSEAGYRFTDAESAESDIQRRYDGFLRDPDAFANEDDLLAQAQADAEAQSEGGDGETVFVVGAQSLNPDTQAKVDELAIEERAIATASWDCNGPLREIEESVRAEYEQRFVDQNGAAIAAALAE